MVLRHLDVHLESCAFVVAQVEQRDFWHLNLRLLFVNSNVHALFFTTFIPFTSTNFYGFQFLFGFLTFLTFFI